MARFIILHPIDGGEEMLNLDGVLCITPPHPITVTQEDGTLTESPADPRTGCEVTLHRGDRYFYADKYEKIVPQVLAGGKL